MTGRSIGIDIGGTKLAAGIVDARGLVAGTLVRAPTPTRSGPGTIMASIVRMVEPLLTSVDHGAIGVGSAGVIARDGAVLSATDSIRDWQGFDLRAELARALDRPVLVLNDVHAAAVGEAVLGAGRRYASFLMVTVGTGVGGAIVRDGVPVRGATGTAGSLGHTAARGQALRECTCGRSGHVEAYAAGPAIEQAFVEATSRRLSLREIAAAARGEGNTVVDRDAEHAVLAGARVLGVGMADAMNLVDLDAIVVGGGVASIGDWYLDAVREAYASSALPGPSHTPVHAAELGPEATLIGAGLYGLFEGERVDSR